MTNTFTVLKKTPNSLNISASNSDELWKKLKEQGLEYDRCHVEANVIVPYRTLDQIN